MTAASDRSMDATPEDRRWMAAALTLAARGLGRVWPNPAVGCIVLREGAVVGRGWTQPGGRPHAETEALARAGAAARGATAYVSLEPCDHHGKTGPCTAALLAAGVARVVVACEDPDPRVNGAGIARLRSHGVPVTVGVMRSEACALNRGFFLRIAAGRPLVTLKLATSVDGRIAMSTGESRWITGEAARARAHELRLRHDAIMVGIGTALADDPHLGCRLPGLEGRSPVRIVVDTHLRLPPTGQLARLAAREPVWVLAGPDADPAARTALAALGVEVIDVERSPGAGQGIDMAAALRLLGARGLTRVLVEGGSRLASTLLRHALVDAIEWASAPVIIGGDGIAAVAPLGHERLAASPRFAMSSPMLVGGDVWMRLEPNEPDEPNEPNEPNRSNGPENGA